MNADPADPTLAIRVRLLELRVAELEGLLLDARIRAALAPLVTEDARIRAALAQHPCGSEQ